jgi:hypothetical protein
MSYEDPNRNTCRMIIRQGYKYEEDEHLKTKN